MALDHFTRLLKDAIGLDTESIGASALERAVRERQSACRLPDALAYWELALSSAEERQRLVEAVVVSETWFFRDRGAFGALGRIVQQEGRRDCLLRVLSVPCSSGEEPYSIAMALQDAALSPAQFQIDAVDVSERALADARRGVYGRNSFRGTDLSFRDRYFTSSVAGYEVVESVRRAVRFHHANLLGSGFLADAGPYDVIFCRNLLIYFDRQTQERAIGVLAGRLAADGFLFVGSSETGALLNRDFVSTGQSMAFAFRRATAADRRPRFDPIAPLPPTRPWKRRVTAVEPVAAASRRADFSAVAVAPDPPRARPDAAPVRDAVDEASQLADQGRFAEAATRCEEHLRQHGPSARAFYLLGVVRDASGRAADAESLYRKAIYLDPAHREALVHLALLMDGQGRQADAQVLRNRVRRLEGAGGDR